LKIFWFHLNDFLLNSELNMLKGMLIWKWLLITYLLLLFYFILCMFCIFVCIIFVYFWCQELWLFYVHFFVHLVFFLIKYLILLMFCFIVYWPTDNFDILRLYNVEIGIICTTLLLDNDRLYFFLTNKLTH
jgi:hypothetical protein